MLFPLTPQTNRFLTTQYSCTKFLTDQGIEKIIKELDKDKWIDVGGYQSKEVGISKEVKSTDRICQAQFLKNDILPLFEISQALRQANDEYWKSKLSHINLITDNISVVKYNTGGLLNWHMDICATLSTRKISFTIQLSDPKDYEGGDLQFFEGDKTKINPALREKGLLIIFPSYSWHRGLPITKGTRYALVGWVHGDHFK